MAPISLGEMILNLMIEAGDIGPEKPPAGLLPGAPARSEGASTMGFWGSPPRRCATRPGPRFPRTVAPQSVEVLRRYSNRSDLLEELREVGKLVEGESY